MSADGHRALKFAFVSPLPPLATGISDYSAELLPYLAKLAEVHLVVENPDHIRQSLQREYPVHEAAALPRLLMSGEVDLPIYQLGNSLYHSYQLDLMRRHPGVIVLHDLVLHHLQAARSLDCGDREEYRRLLVEEHGSMAQDWPERIEKRYQQGSDRHSLYCRLPLSRRIVASSLGVVCHTEYVRRRLRKWLPDHPVRVISPGVEIPVVDRAASRRRLGLGDNDLVVGVLGGLAVNHLCQQALNACASVAQERRDVRICLWDWGNLDVAALLTALGLSDQAVVTGRTSHARFLEDVGALDMGIALRYPTAGETSGSHVRMMSLGVPFVTTDVDAFRELTSRACVKLAPGPRLERELTEVLRRWVWDDKERRAYGDGGLQYAREHLKLDRCARDLIAFAREVHRPAAEVRIPPSREHPSVEAVVVADAACESIRRCLESLLGQDYEQLTVTVVDTHVDGLTASYVAQEFRGVRTVRATGGPGVCVCAGRNQALRNSKATYVALLDQHMVAAENWILELVSVAETDPEISAVGGKMLMLRSPTIVRSAGLALNYGGWVTDRQIGERDLAFGSPPQEVMGVRGGAMLLRRLAFAAVDGFDENLHDLYADVDLCWQLRMAGGRVLCAPRAIVRYECSEEEDIQLIQLMQFMQCMRERDRLRILLKNHDSETVRKVLPQVWNYDKKRLTQLRQCRRRRKAIRRAWRWNLCRLWSIFVHRRKVRELRESSIANTTRLLIGGVDDQGSNVDLRQIHDRSSATSRPEIVMGQSDDGCLGPGWYPLEGKLSTGQWRWCKRTAWFYLRPERESTRVIVRAACPPTASQVELWVEDSEAGSCKVSGGPADYCFELSKPVDGGELVELRLQADTFRPCDLDGSADGRDLGVMVSELRLE